MFIVNRIKKRKIKSARKAAARLSSPKSKAQRIRKERQKKNFAVSLRLCPARAG